MGPPSVERFRRLRLRGVADLDRGDRSGSDSLIAAGGSNKHPGSCGCAAAIHPVRNPRNGGPAP